MAHATVCTCDQCGKDITQGDGRHWMLIVQTQQINRRPDSTPRWNGHRSLTQKHFCDPICLAAWAAKVVVEDEAGQKEYDAVQKAAAAAATKAEAESANRPKAGNNA